MSAPRPTQLTLHQASHVLEIAFDDGRSYRLPYEYLRVESPSAEVQGHGPGQKILVAGKRDVGVRAVDEGILVADLLGQHLDGPTRG